MDYDDNDFQSQNLHLAGEGSAKFPPALRPYALSKFDFDESLQGHLRFDSLVETEVFLGIESNDDNQWIDAYSRGSSGIEFSSSAAETCTISRHNNVWSEATSSESVEMLLKSVGQEEFIPKQTIIEESDACDELATLAKQMEPNQKPDDKSTFIGGGVTDLQPPDRIHESSSGLKEDVGMEQPQTGVSEAHECELSISGNSSNPELNNICQNVDLPVPEGILLTDGKSNNENPKDVVTVADKCVDDKPADGSPTSVVQTNIANASMQSISSTHDVLDIQNVQNQVTSIGDERQGCLPAKADKQDAVSSTLNTDVDMDNQNLNGTENAVGGDAHNQDKPHRSDSTAEALESASVIEGLQAAVSNVEEAFPLVSTGVSELLKADREITCSRNQSGDTAGKDASLHDTMLNDQSDLNTYDLPKAAIKGDTNSEGQVVEFNKSNSGVSPILEQNSSIEINTYGESSAAKVTESVDSGHKMDTKIVVSNSDAHMFTLDDNTKISEGNSDRKAGGFSSFSEPSSAKSCVSGESTQLSENSEVDRQGDCEKFHEDVSVVDKDSKKRPSDASHMHSDDNQSQPAGKDVGSSSLIAGGLETKLTTSAVLVNVAETSYSASLVTSENTDLMSGTIDVSPPPRNGVSTHEATDHNEVQKTTPVESVPIEEKEHSVPKIAEGAHISNPVGSSDLESVICPVPGSEKQQPFDTFKCETLNNCLQAVGAGTGNISKPEEKLAGKDNQGCAKDVGVSSVIRESTAKKGGEAAVSFDKFDKEMTVQETYGKSSLRASDDVLLAHEPSIAAAPLPESHVELHEAAGCHAANLGEITCMASTTIGSSSQAEKDGNEVQASADQNCAVSEFKNRDAASILSTANNPKSNTAFKGERSMTPDVNHVADLSKKDADVTTKGVGKRQSVPPTLAGKASTVVEGSPSSSRLGLKKAKGAADSSHGSPQLSDGETTRSVSKGTPERKTRRASIKTAGKESSRKVSRGKEKSLVRQSERGDKSSNVSLSQSPAFQLMQSNEMQQYGHIDSGSTKPFAFLNASTSGLPDLNTSASPILFQQPFTDLQQVQLRAQIFVYGALIQGTAPDEAYMISAFGGPDGGRNIWETAWRVCMERQHGQKSHPINPETPKQSRYGKQSTHQGKGTPSPLGRASGKPTPTIVNPLIPISSPLWSVPTPSDSLQPSALTRGSVADYPQAVASLHPYQTSPLRNFLGHNASWISQSPLRGPWIASPTSAPDNTSHLSAPPVSDTMKLNSVKGPSLLPSSVIKNDTPNIPASIRSPQSTSVGIAPLLDASNVTPISQHSSDPKPKKRKKVMVSEDHGQKAVQSHSQLEAITAVSAHLSTPVASTAPVGNVPKTHVDKSIVSVSPLSPADHPRNDLNVEKRILSDESHEKVKEARVHAEEAATLSASAVSHSLEIWNQLDKQKNSGLVSDIEAKLASAAVAIAAAAAVAKAAAAAASVASNAAVQAKLMADEALASFGLENSCQSNTVSHSEGMINLEKASPASILKGANVVSSSSSIILAAKEAARRRVEAASAATKQAENMDAIVKAAELTAEAVSQAGKIVTMGDPLPLSDLIEAGTDGYWKAAQEYSQQVGLSKDITRGLVNIDSVGDNPEMSQKHNRDILSDEMQKHATASEKSTLNKMFNETSEDNMRSITGMSNLMNINESNSRGSKGRRVSDLVNLVDVVPETEIQASSVILGDGSEKLADNNIKEGSLVEVFKDGEGFKAAWFTANVLSLNDGKAHVCYNVLLAEEGSGPLKEWVTLEGEVDKPPIIRMARPLNGLRHEGTRKRRRASMGDYVWSVGDRVDAWLQESWWEGVITEKNKKDETFTVHFPAHAETSVVRAWQLRPSFIWKDGKWIECCRKGVGDNSNHEGDTPHEKRPKLGSPALEAKGKDKMSKTIDTVESDELRLLDLAENEKVFNIGKTSRNENKTDAQRMVRTGLQKEGSRVIFGVPKPGKKRKFIEVSKHYVADGSNKVNDGNDSIKLANFLMPQGSRSFGWKNSSKNEAKEKRVDSKPKVFKSGKPQNILGRTVPQKENPSANTISHSKDQTDRTEKIKDSVSQFKNSSESGNQMEIPSYSGTEGAAEGPILYSSLAASTDASSSKKTSTSRASKGKLAPAGGKLGKIEEEKALTGNSMKSMTEVIEPRRSNRRIQPTSRLLEGLQSSLIISKIPSVSHDKVHKNQNRNASKKGE